MLRTLGLSVFSTAVLFSGCTSNGVDIGDDGGAGTPDMQQEGGSGGSAGGSTGGVSGASFGGGPVAGGGSGAAGKANVAGDGGASAQPGAGPGPGCECPSKPLRWWTWVAGQGSLGAEASLDCSGFRRGMRESSDGPIAERCELVNDRCYPEWRPELDEVLALLETEAVQQAIANTPTSFGAVPVMGEPVMFEMTIGESSISLSAPCDEGPGCTPIPEEVERLAEALRRLERHAAMECSPECLPVPPDGDGSCTEPKYYWMYGSCFQAGSRSCEPGYSSVTECEEAHTHCRGLYPKPCGGFSPPTNCDEDEYCGYRGLFACGVLDGSAICLPKPRTCTDEVAPVEGCDGKTYVNLCEASRAGVGQAGPGEF